MKHLIPCRCVLGTISQVILIALVFCGAFATSALAQHGGAHAGGAGHVGAPAVSHPIAPRAAAPFTPIRPPVVFVRPPAVQLIRPAPFRFGLPYRPRPISPHNPFGSVFPVPPPAFGVFGIPFFGLGWGFAPGYSYWWNCDSFAGWGYGCNGLPAYDYGNTPPVAPYSPEPVPQAQVQYWPAYYYGGANSQYAEIILKDSTVYYVTDYWLENGELHYKTVEEHGTRVAEHAIDFDQLDLQQTIDVNTERGFRFVLRNEPIEQYLIDHPAGEAPDQSPPDAPQEPQPAQP